MEDAPAMFENWASDPETLKYVTFGMPMHLLREPENPIKRWIEQYRKPDTYKWALCLKTSLDQVIGDISGFSRSRKVNHAELGYILGKKFWGGDS